MAAPTRGMKLGFEVAYQIDWNMKKLRQVESRMEGSSMVLKVMVAAVDEGENGSDGRVGGSRRKYSAGLGCILGEMLVARA